MNFPPKWIHVSTTHVHMYIYTVLMYVHTQLDLHVYCAYKLIFIDSMEKLDLQIFHSQTCTYLFLQKIYYSGTPLY